MDRQQRNAFLETVFGWAHSLAHAKTSKDRESTATHLTQYVLWAEREHGVKPDMDNYIRALDDNKNTVLSYKEALAVHSALEHAHRMETARLEALMVADETPFTPSVLIGRLAAAKRIMDVKRERADDMGG